RDITTGSITLVSANPSGHAGNDRSFMPEISSDGRYVTFYSFATDLIAGHSTPAGQLYLRDLQTGTNTLLSAAADGTPLGTDLITGPGTVHFSADDRYVAFLARDAGVPEDTNDTEDYYVKDLQTGALRLLSSFGPDGGLLLGFDLTTDGRYAVFSTTD